jgi:hypothetical protein
MRPPRLERFGCGERCWRPEAPDASLGHSRGRHGCQCNELSPHARLSSCPRAGSLPVRRCAAMVASSQQAVRRTLPPNLLRRDRRCCALVRDAPRARRRRQGARFHARAALPEPCCPQRTLPHTRPARAALRRPRRRSDRRPVLSVVRRSLAQVLRLVAEGAVSASRSAARAPGAPVRSAHVGLRCGRRRGAVGGVERSGPSSRRAIVRRPKHQRTHCAVSTSDLRAHRSSPGVWCVCVCARAHARTPACAEPPCLSAPLPARTTSVPVRSTARLFEWCLGRRAIARRDERVLIARRRPHRRHRRSQGLDPRPSLAARSHKRTGGTSTQSLASVPFDPSIGAIGVGHGRGGS